ncbi:hypothetical protein ACQPW1_11265 [Nocardia sp. CA-128927]|uniref:hypothetical protein n=1 Tax=Nocardia sp. CA-128927 TaxID=3239975 RepID=UPI003D952555
MGLGIGSELVSSTLKLVGSAILGTALAMAVPVIGSFMDVVYLPFVLGLSFIELIGSAALKI